MKLTASQLRKIIKEEVKNATLTVEASSNDTYMEVQDVENGKEYSVSVQEGTTPYSVSISFGDSFSINLNTEDARDLCNAIATASVEI